jgi:hypothetical protein
MTATATSQVHSRYYNLDGRAARVLDGRPSTLWTATAVPTPAAPQDLTVTLPAPRRVAAVAVVPRRDGSTSGMVTGWRLEVARGGTFTEVAHGSWATSTATHLVPVPGAPEVTAVRLVVTAAEGRTATVAELRPVGT